MIPLFPVPIGDLPWTLAVARPPPDGVFFPTDPRSHMWALYWNLELYAHRPTRHVASFVALAFPHLFPTKVKALAHMFRRHLSNPLEPVSGSRRAWQWTPDTVAMVRDPLRQATAYAGQDTL